MGPRFYNAVAANTLRVELRGPSSLRLLLSRRATATECAPSSTVGSGVGSTYVDGLIATNVGAATGLLLPTDEDTRFWLREEAIVTVRRREECTRNAMTATTASAPTTPPTMPPAFVVEVGGRGAAPPTIGCPPADDGEPDTEGEEVAAVGREGLGGAGLAGTATVDPLADAAGGGRDEDAVGVPAGECSIPVPVGVAAGSEPDTEGEGCAALALGGGTLVVLGLVGIVVLDGVTSEGSAPVAVTAKSTQSWYTCPPPIQYHCITPRLNVVDGAVKVPVNGPPSSSPHVVDCHSRVPVLPS